MDYARLAPGEQADRVAVTVTFLRLNARRPGPAVTWPDGVTLTRERLDVAGYRKLYSDVGTPWLWWLRRMMPDDLLARHLASPSLDIQILRVDGAVAGFFETDSQLWPDVNLNYFGLMPEFIGRGLGARLLQAAIDSVFLPASPLRGMTVNTCTADHPKALPNYLAAGFVETRRVREIWDIPRRLGLTIPDHLRA
ncbi:MAG: GNAT family N-acetyltransferase [Acidocella sp. 20-57-95]|nr:MAG: GNAT family N-acetyltransferase [Acidocella sp. 20-57-95]OYV60817.1 MAG: GNAT family N-acetyltransferase [Acidocella sp. 21-58-7]HQT64446.1 GNAT family N-acetyltransferase [Acidocella sp.]HQU04607.1 GNAT family N-acetyltransferase [Acidocella sp.]